MVNFTITTSGPAHIGPGAHRARRTSGPAHTQVCVIPKCASYPSVRHTQAFLQIPLNSSDLPPNPSEFLRIPLNCSDFPLNSSHFPLNASEFLRFPLITGPICDFPDTGPEIFFSAHKNYAPPENDGANGEIYARRALGEKKMSEEVSRIGDGIPEDRVFGVPPLRAPRRPTRITPDLDPQ